MRLPLALLAIGAALLTACGIDIADITARPDRYYQQQVTFSGRVTRLQRLPADVLLELANARERRILVRAPAPVDVDVGDWVAVTGVLVPETRIGDTMLYDVIVAERVARRRPPRFRDLT
jgi:hypothetical protein